MSLSPTSSEEDLRARSRNVFVPPYLTPSPTVGSPSSTYTPETIPKVVVRFDEETNLDDLDGGRRRKKGRRGQKKSRGGCFTCKKQKLKCKENRPTCDYCAHRGIKCEWPTSLAPTTTVIKQSKVMITKQINTVVQIPEKLLQKYDAPILQRLPKSIQSHDAPPVQNSYDLQLFHHFVNNAHPNHPRGNESVWTHEIPSLASKHDYLVDSMLALAASELSLGARKSSPAKSRALHGIALDHRDRAVSSLKLAGQHGILTSSEGNAMLATVFTLLFQSTFIADGLVEYFRLTRSAIAISHLMGTQGLVFLFKSSKPPLPERKDAGQIDDAPKVQCEIVRAGIKSLELCDELCETKLERSVWDVLMAAAMSLKYSSSHAYLQLRNMVGLFAHEMTSTQFLDFTSSTSPRALTSKILQAHFVALQLIMNPVASKQTRSKSKSACPVKEVGRTATVGWLTCIHRELRAMGVEAGEWQKYVVWTRWIEKEMLSGRVLDGSRTRSLCIFQREAEASSPFGGSDSSGCPWSNSS